MGKLKLSFHKLTHWEYWPEAVVFSLPIIYYGFLILRARAVYFFSAANPGIRNGGMAMELKHEIYAIQPPSVTPSTLFFKSDTTLSLIENNIKEAGLSYPLIAKPDIGMKGMAVAKVKNIEEVGQYVKKANFDFLIQELITYPNEVGIFYHRYPDQPKGKITGIVKKEFLTVTGDGSSSITELVSQSPRYMLQMDALTTQYGSYMTFVPATGEIIDLVPFGNHARGAKFIDYSHLISDTLTDTFDRFCRDIPGFYYGRLDIRYDTFAALEMGDRFSIIELNGAGADPTHMFDPEHSILYAWREICRHWRIMCDISIINHKKGIPYLSSTQGREMFRQNKAHVKLLSAFSKSQ